MISLVLTAAVVAQVVPQVNICRNPEWQADSERGCFSCMTVGDVNRDRRVDIADPQAILDYLFLGSEICVEPGDANRDGDTDIADASYLMTYLFGTGPPPAFPWPLPERACWSHPLLQCNIWD